MDLNTKMTISVTTSVAVTPDRKDTLTQVETALTALRDKLTGITHRPDNSDPGISDRRARCDTRSAGTFTYICLALKDHTGDHIAWGGGRNCHQWPQAEPLADWEAELLAPDNGFEPSGKLQCQDESGEDGYICTARKGHGGKHMGWWAHGQRDPEATW